MCPPLESELSLDLVRDDGSEFAASIVGRCDIGSKLVPGLADRDIRGQEGITSMPPRGSARYEQQSKLSQALFYR